MQHGDHFGAKKKIGDEHLNTIVLTFKMIFTSFEKKKKTPHPNNTIFNQRQNNT